MVSAEEVPLKNVEDTKKKPIEKRTLRQKLKYISDNITLEPTLACHVIPGWLSRIATQNLYIEKACKANLRYSDDVCDALVAKNGTLYQAEERAIQVFIAAMDSWKSVILNVIPSILILFIGAWSDRTGKRKICILLPIVGELLVCISNIINAFFMKGPTQVAMFFEAFLSAITGGWITTYMGAFSYVSDISSEETRTFRMGIATLCLTAGAPIGAALSGILLNSIGYYGVFGISAALYLFSICYGFFNIKDPERPVKKNNGMGKSSGVWGFLKSFFDVKHVKDTFKTTFKKGPNDRRRKSILLLVCLTFVYGPVCGEHVTKYLFTRYRFNWDASKFSFYSTFFICIHFLGALISINVFNRRWKWDDSVLGLISCVSKVIGSLATGFARTSLEMYIAVAVEMFNATSFTAMRSISSKLVSSDELGKIISVFNLMEVVTEMIYRPIYSWIYMFTLKMDAGVIFYVSCALTLPAIIIFGWFYTQRKKCSPTDVIQPTNDKLKQPDNTRKESLLSSIECEVEKMLAVN